MNFKIYYNPADPYNKYELHEVEVYEEEEND